MDILINNAGIQHVSSVEDFPVEAWDRIMAINLSAVFHTSRLCLPLMKQNNWGRIINVSSVHGKLVALSMCLLDMDTVNRDGAACAAPCQAMADCCSNNCYPHVLSIVCCLDYHKKGLVGSANKSAYVAAKHGVVGFSKVLALETAKTGVTVNNICPGFVLTPLVEKQIEAKAEEINVSLETAKDLLLSEKQPSGEFVTTEQLGSMAAFLCSGAGDQIRGASFVMDGGWTAQ